MAEKLAPDKRHCFVHNGQKVFEWDQTLEEVNIYLDLPPNVPTKLFYCKIQSRHIEVGIRGSPSYLHDGTTHVTLQKRDKGHTWSSPILGQGLLDPYSADLEQKRLMLQRFQEEEPALTPGPSWLGYVLIEKAGLVSISLGTSTSLINVIRLLPTSMFMVSVNYTSIKP